MIACSCEVCSSTDPKDNRLRCAALLDNGDTRVLIDCGPDVRQQLLKTGIDDLDAVVITHEHNDHLIGLDDLRPFIFKRKKAFPIYAEPRVQEEIRQRFAYAFAKTPYPGAPRFELLDLEVGKALTIGSLPPIMPLRVMHGNLPILGFRVSRTAYLTDVKLVPEESQAMLTNLDTLVTSLLHQHEHHSHMNEVEALAFAGEIAAKQTRFIHMSHLAGFHESIERRLPAGMKLGYDGHVITVE
ncbi:MAG: MBL fold metallo-hydrolase [Saprospiraceae bacterium]